MNHMNIEQKLIGLELHDKSIESILVNYTNKEIKVVVLSYSDEFAEYVPHELLFKEFSSFQLKIPVSANLYEHELTNVELTRNKDFYSVTLEMLAGFSQPNYSIEITFKDLEIISPSPQNKTP